MGRLMWPKSPQDGAVIEALGSVAPLFGGSPPQSREEAVPLLQATASAAQDFGKPLTLPPRSPVALATEIEGLAQDRSFVAFLSEPA